MFLLFIISGCDDKTKLFVKHDPNRSGIYFNNSLTPTVDINILTYLYYYNGGGVSAADFNNDSLIDLYFTGNQVPDKLFINEGGLKFKDISQQSGINNSDGWTTGVSHVDINNDGLLDIYVCKIGRYLSIKGHNLLFVNEGVDTNGFPVFTESTSKYGLDFVGFSTHSAFFDYDLDGDLDLFLLNHSVHPNRSYGKGSKRFEFDSLSGDRLYRNDDGYFTDVSGDSGIYQGGIGYGLGLSVGDVNSDGYPDIYIGNDFFENDYLYLNQKDGTFEEVISNDQSRLGHTSHYSMGNSITDFNNDGLPDILSLDMLPENLNTYKTSGNEYPFPTYFYYLKNGYSPQYMQNSLHLNKGSAMFSESAFYSGIAATEWSWGALAADFDLDGLKDLYITNGIKGATNDMDFIKFIAQDDIQRLLNEGMKEEDMKFLDQLPEKKVANYTFRNLGGAKFEDVSSKWFDTKPSFSNGAIYADLDNDGDLDIVVNNINENAYLFENTSNKTGRNYLKVKFKGPDKNRFGIGAKVNLWWGNQSQYAENYTTSSYMSSKSPELLFGLDTSEVIDSIQVVWQDGKIQKLIEIESNQSLTLNYTDATIAGERQPMVLNQLLRTVDRIFNFTHSEETTLEFDREPLIPFAKSNEGPSVTVGDVNGDSLSDIFIGGAKWQAGRLHIQKSDHSFIPSQTELFEKHSKSEDVDNIFFDADNDGDMDLIVVSGGNEFRNGEPLVPRLYLNSNGVFALNDNAFENIEINASVVKTLDLENDGDFDLVIGSNAVPWQYGVTPENIILQNDGQGKFTDITADISSTLKSVGLVEAIAIADIDKNGFNDLIIAGNWMPITIFKNDGKNLVASEIEVTNGWWNSITAADFDNDGDVDLVAGNWGLNTRLKASFEEPINLYRADFDDNGSAESVITYHYQGVETTLSSKDELVKQMPFLNKKFLTYESFAKATLSELFPNNKMRQAMKKQVNELASCYFENDGNNNFVKHKLPADVQLSSVHDIAVDDFNSDGFQDMLLVGNTYEISTQLGRLDASHGTLLLNDQKGFFRTQKQQQFDIAGPARDIEQIEISDEDYIIVTINNDQPVFLKKLKNTK
ncbi:MAG: VCBS repeat-containing protein [Cyclobacteriaceae bacterium]